MNDLKKNICDSKKYELVKKSDYLEEEIKANNTIKTANYIINNLKDYENGAILYFRSIQILGNSLLIKKFGLRSKGRNCQFKELWKEKIMTDKEIDKISSIADIRNNIYYLNKNNEEDKYLNYIKECKEILSILESK